MKACTKKNILILIVFSLIALCSCSSERKRSQKENSMTENNQHQPGTFGYDRDLLADKQEIIVLTTDDNKSQVLISTDYQGRVMTSTLNGPDGYSMGWMNHALIKSGEIREHINPYGGEDRFWLGPEGGQFSLFFEPGVPFDYEHWQTPREIDSEPFDLISFTDTSARFKKEMTLVNYSGIPLEMLVERKIRLLTAPDIEHLLGISIGESIPFVGVETENSITNKGEFPWTQETGMPSVWILGMFKPSPATTIFIPFRKGSEEEMGNIVNDEYFGKVPADRLLIGEDLLFFKGDGKYRSKIGLTPMRAKPVAGSYDEERNVLTIVQFSLPEGRNDYVNSMWALQDHPFAGDAVNSYNDGPLEDGSQMGPFYELESSSPAANLAPGESLVHYHRTIHFKGNEADLDPIARALFGVGIVEIKAAF